MDVAGNAARYGSLRTSSPDGIADNVARSKTISQDHTETAKQLFATGISRTTDLRRQERDWETRIAWGERRRGNGGLSHSNDSSEYEESDSLHASIADNLAEQLRSKLQGLPGLDLVSSQVTKQFMSTISQLQVENEMLKAKLKEGKGTELGSSSVSDNNIGGQQSNDANPAELPLFENIHVVYYTSRDKSVESSYYRDCPRMFSGDTRRDRPRGTIEVEPVDVHLQSHTNLAFVVLDVYSCSMTSVANSFKTVGHIRGRLNKDHYFLKAESRSIRPGPSAELAIQSIIAACPERFPGFEDIANHCGVPYRSPYMFFYLHSKTLIDLKDNCGLEEQSTRHLQNLLGWLEDNVRKSWNEADALFAQGKVNVKHYSMLFQPGEIVVWPNVSGEAVFEATKVKNFTDGWGDNPDLLFTQYWTFNGKPRMEVKCIPPHPSDSKRNRDIGHRIQDDMVDILSLEAYPIRFAEEGLEAKLIARGRKFWRFREKCLVCYDEVEGRDSFQADQRYMVDYSMYHRLHPNLTTFDNYDDPGIVPILDDTFFTCLPSRIHGFDFSKKTWRYLRVDRLTDVTWNKTAFEQLVAPDETKELIQAMVTIHGQQSSAAQDIIDGKGQGLLILLHGGPGTGKTLTAESIAEVQERPLYRVTCGDIGTEPREVEQYLGDVLEIGRAWGCVVLLDEADVFLEERSFTDQKRNAVISIFLRVLEYYDGILILTTNRVGSFDEAFKSRIQLALAYPRLNEEDRLKIWRNFMQMLPRADQDVDMEDLKMNLHRLARVEINGRQIRNVVTMARHLAKFRHEMLRYKHMQDAVRSVQKFNEYLSVVKGFPDDDWARADKLR